MTTERMNLTPSIVRLLTWIRDNPNRQKAEILGHSNLRTAERMQLVYWRGSGRRDGWILTDEGKRQLRLCCTCDPKRPLPLIHDEGCPCREPTT